MTAHWGVQDPAACPGTEEAQRQTFRQVALMLRRRIELFLSLPISSIDKMRMEARLQDIALE